MKTDPHDLQRFIDAQDGVWDEVVAELRAGRKASHWMWFVFPQLKSLGRSETARFYGIGSREEALAYWHHPVLGTRLREAVGLVLGVQGRSLHEIFGSPDDVKFRSSMTLFDAVAPDEPLFRAALDRFCEGSADPLTLQQL